jgi:hypothetical protein
MTQTRDIYMLNINEASGSVFVKTYDFYKSQGGFRGDWGTYWKPVVAISIESARYIGTKMVGARDFTEQAYAELSAEDKQWLISQGYTNPIDYRG